MCSVVLTLALDSRLTDRPTDRPTAERRGKFWVETTRPTDPAVGRGAMPYRSGRPDRPTAARSAAEKILGRNDPTDRPTLGPLGDAERTFNFAPPRVLGPANGMLPIVTDSNDH